MAIREAQALVVGLGNPGPAYVRTRHNVGFQVVERLAIEAGSRFSACRYQAEAAGVDLAGTWVILLKPQTFMNHSGLAAAAWLDAVGLPASALIVVHDDLDLPLGHLRVVESAASGGHRGVDSIQSVLGTQAFCRVRVGIGRPHEGEDAATKVLEGFDPDELPIVAAMVERAAAAVRTLIGSGLAVTMNRYNVRPPVPEAAA